MQTDLPTPQTNPEDIRELADEILRQRKFRQTSSAYERAIGWLSDFFGDIFSALGGSGAGGVIAWGLLFAGAGLIAWLAVKFAPVGPGVRTARAQAVVATGPAATEHLSGDEWRERARAHEAAGELNMALRATYRSVLADLIQAGVLADVPGTTPGEYRRELAQARPAASEDFGQVTTTFESVWYSTADATAADLDQLRRLGPAIVATAMVAVANEPVTVAI